LESRILGAYVQSIFEDRTQYFLPESCIDKLITRVLILEERDHLDSNPGGNKDQGLVDFILQSARKAFAITVTCWFRGNDLRKVMSQFRRDNFQDRALPLKHSVLSSVQCFNNKYWGDRQKRRFLDNQWAFLAPVFSKVHFKLDLEPENILPFT
jgi:hypothetical protein